MKNVTLGERSQKLNQAKPKFSFNLMPYFILSFLRNFHLEKCLKKCKLEFMMIKSYNYKMFHWIIWISWQWKAFWNYNIIPWFIVGEHGVSVHVYGKVLYELKAIRCCTYRYIQIDKYFSQTLAKSKNVSIDGWNFKCYINKILQMTTTWNQVVQIHVYAFIL